MEMEDFSSYRTMCTNRIQRLERYKKARSFCNLEESQSSEASTSEKRLSEVPTSDLSFFSDSSSSSDENKYDPDNTYQVIQNKMMELMENDMAILKQLLALGEKVTEMRKRGLRRSQSTSSMGLVDEEDELEDQFDEPPFSASMSAVTTLVVDDIQPQYFSRQNSVLRIPIQPRRSNRFGSKRVPRRPSEAMRAPAAIRNLRVTTTDESSSESSDGPLSPLSHTPSSVSSKSSVTYSSSSASEVGKKSRSSNSSIDSGIRESADDSSSPSPTFEREVV